MSRENVEVVRQAWEAWERGDLATALGNMSPDMVTYAASPLPFPGTYPGPDGLLRLQNEWAQGFPSAAGLVA